jgi:hypothetical protein
MANKKRKRPPQRARQNPGGGGTSRTTAAPASGVSERSPARGGANLPRRERKEEARQARERARKQASRRAATRRALVFMTAGVVALGVLWWLNRAAAPKPLPPEARAAADAAGCGQIETPDVNPSRAHLQSGQSTTYPDTPPVAGAHDPSPLSIPPHTYDQPIEEETAAVHNLEHGAVIAYYRAEGEGALSPDAIQALKDVADASKYSIAAPYPNLPQGTQLDLVAWNKLLSCAGPASADQAGAIFSGMIAAYECTSNAPEAQNCG